MHKQRVDMVAFFGAVPVDDKSAARTGFAPLPAGAELERSFALKGQSTAEIPGVSRLHVGAPHPLMDAGAIDIQGGQSHSIIDRSTN